MENTSSKDKIIDIIQAAKLLDVPAKSVKLWAESGVAQEWTTNKNNRQIYRDSEDGTIRLRKVNNPLILIVEDDLSIQAYYQAIFEFLLDKPNLEFAINGMEGLRKLLDLNPSLLLADINMPGMDGLEMLRLAREKNTEENLEIIFITGLSKEQIDERDLIPNDIECYSKPLDIDTVKKFLKSANISN